MGPHTQDPDKILVIQLRRIGDVLLTTPAVRALRARFPKARIDFLAEPPCDEVLRGNPNINNVIAYDHSSPLAMIRQTRKAGYDWAIDFLGNPRSALLTALSGATLRAGPGRVFHRWAYNRRFIDPPKSYYVGLEKMLLLEQIGVKAAADLSPELHIPPSSADFARDFFKSENISKDDTVVTLSPTSRRNFNRWFLDRYAQLGDWLQNRFNAKVILVWGPGEKPVIEEVSKLMRKSPFICRQTRNLMDLAAVLSRAELHVGNDNGTKHIATAAGVATFTIYGPHSPASWTYPDSKRHGFIQKDCLCRNDSRRKHNCRELKCLDSISVDAVEQAIEPLLQQILSDKKNGVMK